MAKPLTIYDPRLDSIRPATQEDIDLMQRRLRELSQFRDHVRITVAAREIAQEMVRG